MYVYISYYSLFGNIWLCSCSCSDPLSAAPAGLPYMKPCIKKVTDKCDSCSSKITKGEQGMVWTYYPGCTWFACQKCAPIPKVDEESSLCVFCLDAPAEVVMRGCRHLVFCVKCCRMTVAAALGTDKIKDVKSQYYVNTEVSPLGWVKKGFRYSAPSSSKVKKCLTINFELFKTVPFANGVVSICLTRATNICSG